MFFKILNLVSLYFPYLSVDSACTTTTPTNLYTYYIKTTSTCNVDLQKKSEMLSDVLVELCEITISIYIAHLCDTLVDVSSEEL